MTLKSRDIVNFKEYSPFKDLNEFNHHIEMQLVDVKEELTKSERIGLKRLVRFSAKVPVVCNAKIGTILKAIQEEHNNNGISRSSFKRLIKKLKELGMLTVYETSRKNGSQSSNLYVFHRYPSPCIHSEPPKDEKMNPHKETMNPLKANKKDRKKRNEEHKWDSTYTSDAVPKPFSNLVKCYFDQADVIEEYWKMTKIASYRNNREKDTDVVLEHALSAFKQRIRKLKMTKVKNPYAYYYGVLNNKFTQLYFEELFHMGFHSSD